MKEFIAMIYEWFGYATDLGDHLRGMDTTCTPSLGPDLYFQVFITMLVLNLVLFIMMYILIDKFTTRFSYKSSWWITAIIGMLINFGIASSLPRTISMCDQLHIGSSDLMLYGIANAVWSLVFFALLTSFPFPRNFSTNCRLTTFWKP
ncbi:uncharacterized membrane-anchored protein YitT (DUF2179 family) [Pedobacter cryoconitis]|uniref:Uncharacterized membrane-anchored protein YitT (DUF2179 family) n=1 Tax=Pedobacter cryoconitis TaxID=188932 RepID=A0A7W8ZJN8_9SPHI|nr:hypothetical protein [Pedobacter cryoconitis]MBB5635294.1 uncharacterized membrane-anchored protein YitT (DUF2179 family) [Pedobacter cryoconitis]MBB6274094.1 uncharacterized membrane-anchored protein YitT (DUF2179 family) [Pedobacter cryoconitis]